MNWAFAGTALVQTVEFVMAGLVVLVAFWPLQGIVKDIWQLPCVILLQPRSRSLAVLLPGLFLFFVLTLVLGPDHFYGRAFLVAVLTPTPALLLIRHLAWRSADPEERTAAAEVRNELAGRLHEPLVTPLKSWPQFVFDLERVRRRAEYQPPPI